MSLNINEVRLAGHLTRDPESRPLTGDNSVCNFGLAINRKFKGTDGALKEEVTFVDCEAWGRTAELVSQYLSKGSGAYVEGRLKLDSWQDKDGNARHRLKVVVNNVQFTGPPKGKGESQGDAPAPTQAARKPAGNTAPGSDEPPF